MNEGVLLGLAGVSCLVGFYLNRAYGKKYGEAAVQRLPFALQVIFVGGTLANLPGDEFSGWMIFWLIGLAASYIFGLWKCGKHAKTQNADRVYTAGALAAQVLLPFAAALLLMMLAGWFVFGVLWEH